MYMKTRVLSVITLGVLRLYMCHLVAVKFVGIVRSCKHAKLLVIERPVFQRLAARLARAKLSIDDRNHRLAVLMDCLAGMF